MSLEDQYDAWVRGMMGGGRKKGGLFGKLKMPF